MLYVRNTRKLAVVVGWGLCALLRAPKLEHHPLLAIHGSVQVLSRNCYNKVYD